MSASPSMPSFIFLSVTSGRKTDLQHIGDNSNHFWKPFLYFQEARDDKQKREDETSLRDSYSPLEERITFICRIQLVNKRGKKQGVKPKATSGQRRLLC